MTSGLKKVLRWVGLLLGIVVGAVVTLGIYIYLQMPKPIGEPPALQSELFSKPAHELPVAVPEVALNEVGYQQLGSARVAEAIAVFERAARENPNSANAWDSLALALEQGARPDDALRASRQAVELAARFDLPDRASYERNLSKLQQKVEAGAAPRAN